MTKTKMRNGVVKRGKTYSYVVREPDPATGQTKQRWVSSFPTHAEAVAARAQHLVRIANGTTTQRDDQTLGQYLHEWLLAVDVRPKTMDGYRYNVEHYVIPRLGGTRLQALQSVTLTRFYAELRREGGRNSGQLGWPSVRAVHRTLSTALTAAVDTQLLRSNPADRAKLPPKPRPTTREERELLEMKVLTPKELKSFLGTVGQDRLAALFHLAAYTGCRRGELLYLRWCDWDPVARQLTVSGSRTLAGGRVVEGETKGGRARTIGVDAETAEVLAAHRARQEAEMVAAGSLWQDTSDFIFRTVRGHAVQPSVPTKRMSGICEAAGVPRVRFHDLRHTHATILLSSGAPIHEVAQRLGHADARITLSTYAHVLDARASTLGDAFVAALGRLDAGVSVA